MQKKELTLKIEGMSCGHCTNSVYQTISGVAGVSHAEVNLSEGSAKVEYDAETTSRENIVEAMMETPFQVVGIA